MADFEQANDISSEAIEFDYSFVYTAARIAVYDDLKSAPRIIDVEPGETKEYIDNLASTIYSEARDLGGTIPYTVIREVSENFIHARFAEVVVSIFDQGQTLRFSDQGPGISHKERVQQPGFSSANETMREYIRGVGSGLSIVSEYINFSKGIITIEDNLGTGTVVTLSLSEDFKNKQAEQTIAAHSETVAADKQEQIDIPELTDRQKRIVSLLYKKKALGITDINQFTGMPVSTIHGELTKLEKAELIQIDDQKKRGLTELGKSVAAYL